MSGSLTWMFSNEGLKTSRSMPTMRLSSSNMSDGTGAFWALSRALFQQPSRVLSSLLSSAAPLPSADVRTMTPKFFGLMLSISRRSLTFSSVDFIFCDIEILSLKGISTIKRPVNVISVVRRGPFDDMGSLTICTSSSRPASRRSTIEPCLSMSGRIFIFSRTGSFWRSSRSCLTKSL